MKIPFFSRGGPKPSGKESAVAKALTMIGLGSPAWSSRDYEGFAREGYQQNIIVYRCISLIAGNAAAAPWIVKRKGKEVDEHEALTLLQRPNPTMGRAQLIESLVSYKLLTGNRYIERVGPSDREVRELWPLRPDRVKIIPSRTGVVAGIEYTASGEPVKIWNDAGQPPRVLHSKYFNPLNDWYGQAPLEAAAMATDSHNDATKFNKALLQNNARPSGLLQQRDPRAEPLNDNDYNRLKSELESVFSREKAGRPGIIEGGFEWVQMMLSQMDIDWAKGKELSAREIALAYNVPEQLVGVPGQQTYNNYREARLALFEDAVLPELYSLAEELTNWFRQIYNDDTLTLTIDEDQISALAPRREALWSKLDADTTLTINEKREAKGYDSIGPDGDVLFVSSSMIPLSMAATDDLGGGSESAPTEDEISALAAQTEGDEQPLTPDQIQALKDILDAVKAGDMPARTATQLILVAFPNISREQARRMVNPENRLTPEQASKEIETRILAKAAYGDADG